MTFSSTELLAYSSTILSLLGVGLSIFIWRRQNISTSSITSLSLFINIEKEIAENPDLLRFHGIQEDDLKEAGFTVKEFSYLVASFTAGSIYHRSLSERSEKPFPENHYRYNLLLQEDTRRIWPFISKMIGNSHYKKRIESTIKLIEATNN